MAREYKGFNISKFQGRNHSGFRWTAYKSGYGFLHSETLAGMRELINHTLGRG